jgi:hypothetical protein
VAGQGLYWGGWPLRCKTHVLWGFGSRCWRVAIAGACAKGWGVCCRPCFSPLVGVASRRCQVARRKEGVKLETCTILTPSFRCASLAHGEVADEGGERGEATRGVLPPLVGGSLKP